MTCRSAIIALTVFSFAPTFAGPVIEAGDLALRHDIQRLADYGIIKGPTTTWPLPWGPVLEDLQNADLVELPADVADAVTRIRARAAWEASPKELVIETKLAIAEDPTRIRSFQNTPRGKLEVSAGASWIDEWLALDLNVQGVDSDQDSREIRVDNSMVGIVTGNWSISANTMDRWWGPGWDGSIILSNNARPFPSLTLDRVFTDSFESKWLSWIGPWDVTVTFGQLESQRHVPNARFFGMRFNFRPLHSLEIGISRTAQWCGDGRPCDVEAFGNLFLGRDNRGGGGVNINNEPGNQLAGVDFRWTPGFLGFPVAIYGQFTGEDEAGGFPSRWLGQFGGEWSGHLFNRWSTRLFAEFAGTSCQFYESSELFNCAYEHGIYQSGYRFRGRSIGHGADNDAQIVSAGIIAVDSNDRQWRGLIRIGALNRGGIADPRNTVTPTRKEIASIDLSHSRDIGLGVVDAGIGHERLEDDLTSTTTSSTRFYLQWRSSF